MQDVGESKCSPYIHVDIHKCIESCPTFSTFLYNQSRMDMKAIFFTSLLLRMLIFLQQFFHPFPFLFFQILGIEQDRAEKKTEVVHNNGFNPIWNETFKFRVLCPELALLYFRVKDYSNSGTDVHLAHFAVPLESITTGKYKNLSSVLSDKFRLLSPSIQSQSNYFRTK